MPQPAPSPAPTLVDVLLRESSSMTRYLLTMGTRVPPAVVQTVDQLETARAKGEPVDVQALAGAHERLAKLVAPARPGTLYMMDTTHQLPGRLRTLGPISLVRAMVTVALLSVAIFIVLSVVELVDAHATVDLFVGRRMIIFEVILQRVFWLSAAAIGASFAMLFQVNEFITNRTYDPDHAPTYWIKFFIGMVAGFILVALVPLDGLESSGAQALAPATIALLGGFSASAVYRILNRLVEALESLFSGSPRDEADAREKTAAARAAEEAATTRIGLAGKLVQLQQQVAAGSSADTLSAQLQQLIGELTPAASEDGGAPDAGASRAAKVQVPALVGAPEDAGTDESTDGNN
ncbi:MAG TPA: hypothetical protein VFX98_05145 [Longimicrobiaceae bacterium]|nr:hypothetical protein [Longimicrobiaceae bacterium]